MSEFIAHTYTPRELQGYKLASASFAFAMSPEMPDATLKLGSFGAVLETRRNYNGENNEKLRKYFHRVVGHFCHAA